MKKDFTKDEINFINKLKLIQQKLWSKSFDEFKRLNPLIEDITNWKQKGKFLFGDKNITIYDSSTIVGDVIVGENTWIGPYTALDGTGGLQIGKNCSISSGVNIVSHDSVKWALSGGKEDYEYSKISIGDNCFIGTRSFISRGVTIGSNCLIAAGSVVAKSFPENTIIAGIPAKKIGTVGFDQKGKVDLIYDSKVQK